MITRRMVEWTYDAGLFRFNTQSIKIFCYLGPIRLNIYNAPSYGIWDRITQLYSTDAAKEHGKFFLISCIYETLNSLKEGDNMDKVSYVFCEKYVNLVCAYFARASFIASPYGDGVKYSVEDLEKGWGELIDRPDYFEAYDKCFNRNKDNNEEE